MRRLSMAELRAYDSDQLADVRSECVCGDTGMVAVLGVDWNGYPTTTQEPCEECNGGADRLAELRDDMWAEQHTHKRDNRDD